MPEIAELQYGTAEIPFTLPPELNEIKLLTRRIVNEQCIPLEQEFLRRGMEGAEGSGEAMVEGALEPGDRERLTAISKETGLYSMHLPEEHGGGGFGVLGSFVVGEEINRSLVRLPTANVPNILFNANEDQRERYLEPMIRGELRSCFAQTEPNAGSDPGNSMQTRAVRDGDDWVINGTKMFISGADTADFMMLQAVTDPEKRQRGGITMFLIDKDTPGVSMSPISVWLTPRKARQFHVYLDDVRVPHGNVLGEVGNGFRLGQQWLAIHDRLSRGTLAAGILSRGLEMATEWAKERVTFGEPLAERQAIQWMLVDIFIDLKCIRALSYECAARADRGEDVRTYAAMAKFIGANWGHRSVDKLMQIFGGLGETLDMPIPHWYRVLRHGRIGGGSDEMQRMLIARALFGQGKSLWEA
jgi:acyl-CoA dehydrogenase